MHDEGHTCILLNLPCELALVIEACSGQVPPPLIEVFAVLFQHGACTPPAKLELCAGHIPLKNHTQLTIDHTASIQLVLSCSFVVVNVLKAR